MVQGRFPATRFTGIFELGSMVPVYCFPIARFSDSGDLSEKSDRNKSNTNAAARCDLGAAFKRLVYSSRHHSPKEERFATVRIVTDTIQQTQPTTPTPTPAPLLGVWPTRPKNLLWRGANARKVGPACHGPSKTEKPAHIFRPGTFQKRIVTEPPNRFMSLLPIHASSISVLFFQHLA